MFSPRSLRNFVILILAATYSFSGCATLIRKVTQRIPVTSSPAGATVTVNGVQQGLTPLEIKLTRGEKDQVILIEYPGYNPYEIRPQRKTSGKTILGNVLLGAACATPITVAWMLSNDEDYGAGLGLGGVAFLSTAGLAGLFTVLDYSFKKGYEFRPRELTVTLTKADGTPRVDTMLVEADDFHNIKWIRVHRD